MLVRPLAYAEEELRGVRGAGRKTRASVLARKVARRWNAVWLRQRARETARAVQRGNMRPPLCMKGFGPRRGTPLDTSAGDAAGYLGR